MYITFFRVKMSASSKQYKCTVCNREFGRESALENHINLAHPTQRKQEQSEEKEEKSNIKIAKNNESKATIQISKLKFKKGKPKKSVFIASKFLQIARRRNTNESSFKDSKKSTKIDNSSAIRPSVKSPDAKTKSKATVRRTKSIGKIDKHSEPETRSRGAPSKSAEKKEPDFNAALQFGFKSAKEMFRKTAVSLSMERIEVPDKLWPIIEKIETEFRNKQNETKTENANEKLPQIKSNEDAGSKRNVRKRVKRDVSVENVSIDKKRKLETPQNSEKELHIASDVIKKTRESKADEKSERTTKQTLAVQAAKKVMRASLSRKSSSRSPLKAPLKRKTAVGETSKQRSNIPSYKSLPTQKPKKSTEVICEPTVVQPVASAGESLDIVVPVVEARSGRAIKKPTKFMDQDFVMPVKLNAVSPKFPKSKAAAESAGSRKRKVDQVNSKSQRKVDTKKSNATTNLVPSDEVSVDKENKAPALNESPSLAVGIDGKEYTCEICSRGFSRLAALEKHKNSNHQKQQRFPAVKFTTKDAQKQVKGAKRLNYKCSICKKLFSKQANFNEHMKTHASVKCSDCGKLFKDRKLLNAHRVKVHKEDPFSCKGCTDTFLTKSLLQTHIKLVHNDNDIDLPVTEKKLVSFDCEICGKKFNRKSRFDSHWETHEKSRLKCDVCDAQYKSFDELMLHSCDDNMHPCPECTLRFKQRALLNQHIGRVHKDKPFVCRFCKKKFATQPALKGHENSHSEANEMMGLQISPESDKQKWKLYCEMCNQRFSSLNSKKQHMTKVHGPEWRHLCVVCCKIFPDRGMLLRHQIIHKTVGAEGESYRLVPKERHPHEETVILNEESSVLTPMTPYVIETYQSSEPTSMIIEDEVLDSNQTGAIKKEDLISSEKLVFEDDNSSKVSDVLSIRCNFCKDKFSDVLALNEHIQSSHYDELNPQYKCEICLESFRAFTAYVQHMRTHPESMLFTCKFCDKRFFTEKRLNAHMTMLHKDEIQEYQCKYCDELFHVSILDFLQTAVMIMGKILVK